MPEIAQSRIEARAPQAQLIRMATGYSVSSLPNETSRPMGQKTADELALSIGADTPSLYRVMRTLCGVGLFPEDSSYRFSNSAALRQCVAPPNPLHPEIQRYLLRKQSFLRTRLVTIMRNREPEFHNRYGS
jgi:hypothetical protein